jgi:hypothetical protein
MQVNYHIRVDGTRRGSYVCPTDRPPLREVPRCQTLAGRGLDEAISNLVVEIVTPLTLEVACQSAMSCELAPKKWIACAASMSNTRVIKPISPAALPPPGAQDLPMSNGLGSIAYAINNNGVSVGHITYCTHRAAVAWHGDSLRTLPGLGGNESSAFDINVAG